MIFFCNYDFDSFDIEYGVVTWKSQLRLYFEEPRVERTMEINFFDYYKQNQFRYPEFAATTRDILAIPISIVAFEYAFNIGGEILD